MNAWNFGSFDNDSARDFTVEVVQDGGVALREAFEVVLDPDMDYVEVEEGARALAAAEILAAVLTGDTQHLTDAGLRHWVQNADKTSLSDLRALAAEALNRVLAPDSELPEQWEDTADSGAWLSDVQRLRSTLG
ncbi:DUF4259 domain-containing protein [Deinococcus cavernae]|uniref:DUF4259 domain-containing protein n=1 Tax=Deinococcus cavernae TaxID=2320857 RepID=A0A418V536_9DEIO|nr:DUF4259 domain-containing protein [Deinococcus cavernae]RJF71218.1 DUF4259 domain-containing protein [Deinococcus cavernae]